ncbi:MAG: ABC transporter substrate-binding protein [Pseudomonadota bacterium]
MAPLGGQDRRVRRGAAGGALVLGLLGLAAYAGPGTAAPLTPQEALGKQIYLEGKGIGGREIPALVGKSSLRLEASAVPCASCHGRDGRGRPEGGVVPPRIAWEELAKPWGHRHASGREHGPFDEASLAAAVSRGTDPAGNRLDETMPRYALEPGEAAALVAYLKRLENDFDPGLSTQAIRVGTVLPLAGPLAPVGQAMKAVLEACFQEVNTAGGVFGRSLELVVTGGGGTSQSLVTALRGAEREGPAFVLVAPFAPGAERQLWTYAERERVPLVGPVTLFPAKAAGRYSFFLVGGVREQGMALARYGARALELRAPAFALIHPDDGHYGDAADAIEGEARALGWRGVGRITHGPGKLDVRALAVQARRAEVVFFLGPGGALADLVRAMADQGGTPPYVLAPGSAADRALLELPDSLAQRVFLAYPSLPEDYSPEAVAEFERLRSRYRLPSGHFPAQAAAYTAARTLVEALKRTGRDLSREKLVDVLEGFRRVDVGLAPPLTFGPNRRIGSAAARIVGVDAAAKRFRPVEREEGNP